MSSERPTLTLLGATDALSCEGDTCAVPAQAEVPATEKASTPDR